MSNNNDDDGNTSAITTQHLLSTDSASGNIWRVLILRTTPWNRKHQPYFAEEEYGALRYQVTSQATHRWRAAEAESHPDDPGQSVLNRCVPLPLSV